MRKKATRDGRVHLSFRAYPWIREVIRHCCVLQQELDKGCGHTSGRPPNGLSAEVIGNAMDRHAEYLESRCERRHGGEETDWRESVEAREARWRRTALGEVVADASQFHSPPPQALPTVDED